MNTLTDAELDRMETEARKDFPDLVPSDIRQLVREIKRLRAAAESGGAA